MCSLLSNLSLLYDTCASLWSCFVAFFGIYEFILSIFLCWCRACCHQNFSMPLASYYIFLSFTYVFSLQNWFSCHSFLLFPFFLPLNLLYLVLPIGSAYKIQVDHANILFCGEELQFLGIFQAVNGQDS